MVAHLENADVELEQARRGYGALARALGRWRFSEPPRQAFERLERLAAAARQRLDRALPRLSPRDAQHARRLARKADQGRQRVVDAAIDAARRLGLAPQTLSTADLLDALYKGPAPSGPPGSISLRLTLAGVGGLVLLPISALAFPLLPALGLVSVGSLGALIATAAIPHRRFRYPATALAASASVLFPACLIDLLRHWIPSC
jgi:hypothetical protein